VLPIAIQYCHTVATLSHIFCYYNCAYFRRWYKLQWVVIDKKCTVFCHLADNVSLVARQPYSLNPCRRSTLTVWVIMFIPHLFCALVLGLHLCVKIFWFLHELLSLFANFYKNALYCSYTYLCVCVCVCVCACVSDHIRSTLLLCSSPRPSFMCEIFRFMHELLFIFANFYKMLSIAVTPLCVYVCVFVFFCVCAHVCVIMFIPHVFCALVPDLHLCVKIFWFMHELLILFANFYKNALYCSHTPVCVCARARTCVCEWSCSFHIAFVLQNQAFVVVWNFLDLCQIYWFYLTN